MDSNIDAAKLRLIKPLKIDKVSAGIHDGDDCIHGDFSPSSAAAAAIFFAVAMLMFKP